MTRPLVRVICAHIERNGRYLITQRRPSAVLPLLWEFPGGRIEAAESDAAALARVLADRVGLVPTVLGLTTRIERSYARYDVSLALYRCDIGVQQPWPRRVQDVRFVASNEFERYAFTPADEAAMNALLFTAPSQGLP